MPSLNPSPADIVIGMGRAESGDWLDPRRRGSVGSV